MKGFPTSASGCLGTRGEDGRHRSRWRGGTKAESINLAGTLSCFSPKEWDPPGCSIRPGQPPRTGGQMLISSPDDGQTWSKPNRLPEGFPGPGQEQADHAEGRLDPRPHELRRPRLGASISNAPPTLARTWQTVGPVDDDKTWEAIQPTSSPTPTAVSRPFRGVSNRRSSNAGRLTVVQRPGPKLVATTLPTPLPHLPLPPPSLVQSYHQSWPATVAISSHQDLRRMPTPPYPIPIQPTVTHLHLAPKKSALGHPQNKCFGPRGRPCLTTTDTPIRHSSSG